MLGFGNSRCPFDRKIAIIGCGPSGIFTCYFLNKLGYTNIHLYGDINDAQPRTILVDDIVCDVATIYGHNGYANSIRRVASEFHFDLSSMDPPKAMTSGIIAQLEADQIELLLPT